MQLDWFTLVAQIVNFLILVFFLRYFLYDPVLSAMDSRQQEIQSRYEEAEKMRDKAEQEAQKLQDERLSIQEHREQLMKETEQEVDERQRELMEEARQDVNEKRRSWLHDLERDRQEFVHHLGRKAGQEVIVVSRRTLKDLTDTKLEQKILDTFMHRLSELDEEQREMLLDSIRNNKGNVNIASSFDIPYEYRKRMRNFLEEELDAIDQLEVSFQETDEIFCGLRLETDGRRLSWSMGHYLDQLQTKINDILIEKTKQVTESHVNSSQDEDIEKEELQESE